MCPPSPDAAVSTGGTGSDDSIVATQVHEGEEAQEPIVAQQLAQESGYHSYSTFSTAFKRRMDKSVTAWMREEEQ